MVSSEKYYQDFKEYIAGEPNRDWKRDLNTKLTRKRGGKAFQEEGRAGAEAKEWESL